MRCVWEVLQECTKCTTYCVPDRSIMDNLFLIRDLLDVCKLYNIDFGIVSLD